MYNLLRWPITLGIHATAKPKQNYWSRALFAKRSTYLDAPFKSTCNHSFIICIVNSKIKQNIHILNVVTVTLNNNLV